MELYSLILSKDYAWEIMDEIGKKNALHFIDLNLKGEVYNKPYVLSVKRCDETERRIKYIELECVKHSIPLKKPKDVNEFLAVIEKMQEERGKSGNTLLDEFEAEVTKSANFLNDQAKRYQDMKEKHLWLVEYRHVLAKTREIQTRNLPERVENEIRSDIEEGLLQASEIGQQHLKISTISGVIDTDDCDRFKRLIFRITRGNSLVIFDDFNELIGDEAEVDRRKSIYVILYREGEALKSKIARVCDTFSRERFEITDNSEAKELEIIRRLEETSKLLQATREERLKVLKNTVEEVTDTGISRLELQHWYVCREKSLYTTLNKLEVKNTFLRGLCWCPARNIAEIANLIEEQNKKRTLAATFKKVESHTLTPPSFLRVNDFTFPFQEIVSTYGTPTYREVNPAFFTTVTFPFLFGVMFGDICHGLILFCFGILLCWYHDTLAKSKALLAPLAKIRYLVLLMGFFAVFCGFIYNEFAGLNLNLFSSCYTAKYENDDTLKVVRKENCVYPFGIDPFWKYSVRALAFENPLKMKLSVIIAVLHMFMGVCLKLVNSLYFGKTLDVFFEFIPQAIFLLAMFGYMDILIVLKWTTNYDDDTSNAPNIITAVINMFIGFGKTTDLVFEGQDKVNYVMLALILLCIPAMLLPKPFLLKRQYLAKYEPSVNQESIGPIPRDSTITLDQPDDDVAFRNSILVLQPKEEEFSFSEVFVHQLIETIEYALGTISNTASYLRLWALSLAHAQLSDVFLHYAVITVVGLHLPSYLTFPIVCFLVL